MRKRIDPNMVHPSKRHHLKSPASGILVGLIQAMGILLGITLAFAMVGTIIGIVYEAVKSLGTAP